MRAKPRASLAGAAAASVLLAGAVAFVRAMSAHVPLSTWLFFRWARAGGVAAFSWDPPPSVRSVRLPGATPQAASS